jgi:hypothetical protein
MTFPSNQRLATCNPASEVLSAHTKGNFIFGLEVAGADKIQFRWVGGAPGPGGQKRFDKMLNLIVLKILERSADQDLQPET